MEYHNWRCRECNQVLSQIGITSLSFVVQLHDKEVHGVSTNRTSVEIEAATQYFKSMYSYSLASSGRIPSMEEYAWLRRQCILWDGDNRTPAQLAQRYRNKTGTV